MNGKSQWKPALVSAALAALIALGALMAEAAPPVRIAVVPASGSGQEQSAVDGITSALAGNQAIALSTVNPDWYVVCNIVEQTDTVSGTVKVNGTVTIKTADGQILNNISVQANKSDFSLSPGAPLNKAMVEGAVREVIAGMAQRAVPPIEQAVQVEMDARDRIIQAQTLGDQDRYEEAVGLLLPITPDTPHFKAVRALIGDMRMEQDAFDRVKEAEASAGRGQYVQAIKFLNGVSQKSKRYKLARARIGSYQAALAKRKTSVNKK